MPRRLPANDPRLAAPDYPHGTERGYEAGCSCAPCRSARAASRTERRRLAAPDPETYGRKGLVDVEPIAQHLELLLEVGTLTEVAAATGVSRGCLDHITKRHSSTVKQHNADAIRGTTRLAVISAGAANYLTHGVEPVRAHVLQLMSTEACTATAVAKAAGIAQSTVASILGGSREHLHETTCQNLRALTVNDVLAVVGYLSPERARTRLGSLQANGWSIARLSELLGYTSRLEIGRQWISPALDAKIRELYERIEDRPGGNTRVAEAAAADGFHKPIYYDDDMNLVREWIPETCQEDAGDPQLKARNSLRIMGLTIRDHSESAINQYMDLEHATGAVQTARRKIGLRLESTRVFLTDSLVQPGQDDLVALIDEHTRQIAVYESTEVLDAEGLDYVALWRRLGNAVKELRAAPAVEESAPQQLVTAA